MVWDFPLWGTGCGTYELADMLHRTDAADEDMVVDHAHNDYLEMLVEGGLAQLVPGVLAMILVFRLGLGAASRLAGEPAGGMAIGALMGFATVAIHSFSDFGLHIPSCAALAVVLAALLCGLGGGEERRGGPGLPRLSVAGNRTGLRLRGLVPALGAGSALALGLVIAHEGWRAYRVQQIQGPGLRPRTGPATRPGWNGKSPSSRRRPAWSRRMPASRKRSSSRTSTPSNSGCTS